MDRARYAVDAVVIEGRSLRSVASSLDMSKSWVAKQVVRFHSGGYEALVRQTTAPHRRPTQTPVELENEIVTMRKHLDEEGFDAGPLTIQYLHCGIRGSLTNSAGSDMAARGADLPDAGTGVQAGTGSLARQTSLETPNVGLESSEWCRRGCLVP